MTTGPIGPGTVLAGRYRLVDLLAESAGARFWRATDTVLARSVAIHALPSEDPRAPGLLEAARVSATVVDTHLLRVLDCEEENGITWVVNEWGDGISLDLMLQHGPLPPSRAAWLTREVAEAIAAGHAQGVAHGRLNPEAVLLTHAGAVKLIGYVVDASLQHPRPPDPLYGEINDREADVINLAGILYASLTGRWPGVAPSAVPTAPREARRPLRPRQVRAGVPRTLDAICERVLHKEASLHAMPIETAHEIAAALADYVGDPALSAPVDAIGIHSEPVAPPHRDDQPEPAGAAPDGPDEPEAEEAATEPALEPDPELDVESDPDATQLHRVPGVGPGAGPGADPAADLGEGTEALDPFRPPPTVAAPPPPFPDTPERPLFADTERRVPTSARTSAVMPSSGWADEPADLGARSGPGAGPASGPGSGSGSRWAGATAATGTPDRASAPSEADTGSWNRSGHDATGFWPFDVDSEEASEHHAGTGKEGRGWLRSGIAIGILLLLLISVAVAAYRARQDPGTPSGDGSGTSNSSPAARPALEIAGVSDFDPESDDPEENSAEAPRAVDGDPATSWRTSTYYNDPLLGGLKSGVGLMVDLGAEKEPGAVTVRFKGAPTSFEVYAAPAGATAVPQGLDGLDKVASRTDAAERATVQLDPAPRTRYVLVWLTKLPAIPDGFRGEIAEITVRS